MSASPPTSVATLATAKAQEPEAAKGGEYGRSEDAQEGRGEGDDYDAEEDARQEEYFRNKASTKPNSEAEANETLARLDEIEKSVPAAHGEGKQPALEKEDAEEEEEEEQEDDNDDLDDTDDSEEIREEEYFRNEASFPPMSDAEVRDVLSRTAEIQKRLSAAYNKKS